LKRLAAILLFSAFSAAAQPVITNIAPNNGPAAGGTAVTITGSGFSICDICSPALPPTVLFGGTPVTSELVNANTLRVSTPAHFPGTVTVSVEQHNGRTSKSDAFTFTGTIEEAFDRVLLPLFIPPVEGAFGSRFVTELRLANSSPHVEATLFGLMPVCNLSACIFPDPVEQPYVIAPSATVTSNDLELTGNPGAFLYIPKSAPALHANLRVYDDTRRALNFGTEIPVVYDHEFSAEPIKLLGVPLDPRFRNTLRIYAPAETTVEVAFNDIVQIVTLHAGDNLLDPAYAQLSGITGQAGTIDVTVSAREVQVLPIEPPVPFWAFISVTNNETQLISTITPQR
jgi:hypothetical protein